MSDDTLTPPAGADDDQPTIPGVELPASGPAPKRPPRRRASGKPAGSGAGRPTTAQASHATRRERMTGVYEQLGGFAQLAIALPTPEAMRIAGLGVALVDNAEAVGEAWATWADTSPRVARMIDGLAFGGGALGVILAHVPIAMAIVNPPQLDPEALAFADQLRGMMANGAQPAPPVDGFAAG